MTHRSRVLLLLSVALLVLGAFAVTAFARPGGVSGSSQTGCTCHGSSNGVVTFNISGPGVLPYNTTGNYTLTINGGDGTAMGIDMTVSAGTLGLVTTTNLELVSNEIMHTSRLTNRNISFTVTAPASGTSLTIYYSAAAGFSNWSSGSTATPLPVQLSSFTVQLIPENFAKLEWATLSELNNYGFRIQRRAANDQQFTELPGVFVAGHGTTTVPQSYTFTDKTASAGTWYYRLNQIDLDGSSHLSEAVSVSILTGVEESTPNAFALLQNYPNPFNPSTSISYQLAGPGRTTLVVYDALGRTVATLVDAQQDAGSHTVNFNAMNLASGVYMYRLTSGERTDLKKMVMVK